MNDRSTEPFEPFRQASSEDVRRTLGDLDATIIVDILAQTPTVRDLDDAALWRRGDGDLIAREHRQMSASARAITEILARADDDLLDDPDAPHAPD